ncbi:hypothetical protein BACCAP_02357 [Pseudoflavonifractor capillosus ATCC 29799]|uniref:Uncharacterized protein n=1 Tax=Pseudoflavonifractor capillosus ATCC 29799 TaxID=411467 RepID=A6NVW4_9FIRM|nr:hypothetical protein BACCAP_02357 [Pseudoflavonifractor capillosus ATCC 29799]
MINLKKIVAFSEKECYDIKCVVRTCVLAPILRRERGEPA